MPTVMANKSDPGQKNFGLGGARAPFVQWCVANGYDEKTVFLAGVLALQELTHGDRVRYFRLVDEWSRKSFAADEDGTAAVVTRPAEIQERPAEKTPSQGSRRAG